MHRSKKSFNVATWTLSTLTAQPMGRVRVKITSVRSKQSERNMKKSTDKFNKVLLVDDSASMRSFLGAILSDEGYQVVGSLPSGNELSKAVASLEPDIVCLDYNLPGQNGLELLRELRGSSPGVAVVMITGDLSPSIYNQAVDIGTAGFLRKPFKQAEISGLMKQVSHALRLLKEPIKSSAMVDLDKPRVRAVIAEDSSTLRQLLRAILEEMYIDVVAEARNGMEAVELTEQHNPDIVCLDVVMPVMTGFEALEKIRAARPQIKVMMITSKASKDSVLEARAKGAMGYILKPYLPDSVVSQIAALVAIH